MLALALVIISRGEAMGLPTKNAFLPRFCLMLMGLWWAAFSVPILWICARQVAAGTRGNRCWNLVRDGLVEVGKTLRQIRRYRMLSIFLLGFLIFNDGVQTVISQASVFAGIKFDMKITDLAPVFLMIQFVALPGALFVGWIADRIGQKTTLNLCLAIWVMILLSGFLITEQWHFWVMAAVTALVLGGTQSVSRAIMGLMTPAAAPESSLASSICRARR